MKKAITVLLTSVGGITGTYLTKHFSGNADYRLIGVDMQPDVSLQGYLSNFFQVPASGDHNFMDAVKEIVRKEEVDVIIPVSSYDVDAFSKNTTDILFKNRMMVMPYEQHRNLHDKKKCYEALERVGVAVPKTVPKDCYPYVMKKRIGSGGKGVVAIESKEDFQYWSLKMEDYICVERLKGDEYTVDCLFDRKGICVGYNTRKRMKTAGGGVVISQNCKGKGIDRIISTFEREFSLCGPINFQFKYDENGDIPIVFDVNTRLASGGLPLTVASGFDIPDCLVRLVLNQEVAPWTCSDAFKELTMYRYYEEVFR